MIHYRAGLRYQFGKLVRIHGPISGTFVMGITQSFESLRCLTDFYSLLSHSFHIERC